MSGIKGKSGTYKRKIKFNSYIDCGDYYKIFIKNECQPKIDKNDLAKIQIGKWSFSKTAGYPVRVINKKMTTMHQAIIGKKQGYFIDHINGDRFDNRKNNLRFVTPQQSACNRSNMRGIYISNYYKNKKQKKWVAHIIYKNKFHYLGIFDNEKNAINERKKAEVKFFGDFRRK